ncbi:P2Y purinoceptor 3 [Amphiprion ocellaris]|uniref:G-protein coupled receptors family 1 profile domain-containing protein n=1 Tax=Amphiprion ocellaris TaxID=80972 RepID=A0AAQ5XD55_AMPOC|nr:P2Y purinoceptor 3 [Amphiprion ocellaris]XP_054867952.1 P2Y purinoceptor 3 [Amphiprion ocellaris]
MQHSFSSLPTETLISKTFPLDLFSTSIHPTDPYAADSFIPSNISNSSGVVSLRCTYKEDFKRILLPAVYTIVFLLGLPLNAAVILKIWGTRPNLSKNNIYMLNLAIADFLYVMSLPLLIYNYGSHDYWPFGEFACKLVRFQFYSNLHGSILFLTCISVQRYVGICHPFAVWHKQGGRRMAWCICGAVWLVVAALCAPTFHFAATGIQRNRTVCYDLSTPERSVDYYPYGMALTFLGFLLPFIGVMVCYCRMAHILCRPVSYQGVSMATGEKRDKAVRMIIVVAVVFCISFLPFHLTKTMYLVVRTSARCETKNLFSIIYKSTRPFASMNSFLDPILFYFTQPRYRRSTKKFVLKVTSLREKGTSV